MNVRTSPAWLAAVALFLTAGCASSDRFEDHFADYPLPPPATAPPVVVAPAVAPPVVNPDAEAMQRQIDASMAEQIRRGLYGNPSLGEAAGNVQVSVEHSTVTLRGTVPSEQARETVNTLVTNTRGVAHVDNQLQVQIPATGRPEPTGPVYSTTNYPGVNRE